MQAINIFATPRSILAVLWFFCAVKLFFDMDYLKLTPSNVYLYANGKLRHENIDPYLPSSVARDPTLFDFITPDDPLPHLNSKDEPKDPNKQYITLRDVAFANNAIDLFSDFKIGATFLIESLNPSSGSEKKSTSLKPGLEKSKLPKELNALPAKL
jgi:hypothetical protein